MNARWSDAVYWRQRESFHVAMLRVINRCAPRMRLRGSFKHGDFHFDRTGRTFSDVDLVFSCARGDRHEVARQIEESIADLIGQRLRVSVQPRDTQSLLNLDDARFLASGDYLRQRLTVADCGAPSDYLSYLLGKAVLGVLRAAPEERGSDVFSRSCCAGIALAWSARLGQKDGFGVGTAVDVLAHHPQNRRAAQLADWLGMPPRQALEQFGAELRFHHQIDPWLRDLFRHLVENAQAGVVRPHAHGAAG